MCLVQEEQDSIRALATTSEETAKLARTLYRAVMSDRAAKSEEAPLRPSRVPFFNILGAVTMVHRKASG
jgi:hypothetical protein